MSAGHYSFLCEAEHFYVAESTIPGAGWGLFAKRDIPMQAHPVLEYSGSRLRVYLNNYHPRRQRAPLSLEYLMEVSPGDGKGLGPCLVDASDPHRSGAGQVHQQPVARLFGSGSQVHGNRAVPPGLGAGARVLAPGRAGGGGDPGLLHAGEGGEWGAVCEVAGGGFLGRGAGCSETTA